MTGDDQIEVQRRYIWKVKPFTEHDGVCSLFVIIEPSDTYVLYTVKEVFDKQHSDRHLHVADWREREVYAERREYKTFGSARELGQALHVGELRGKFETDAIWFLCWAIATKEGTPSDFAKKWLPEWAAWLLKHPLVMEAG